MERVRPRAGPSLAQIEDVYRHQYRKFLRVALAMLHEREQAHDAVQETFARAIQRRFEMREEGSLEGWLWRTLTNHCLDVLRARWPGEPVELNDPEAPHRDALEHADLHSAIAALPERQRTMVFLRHYADLDYEQIAEATGVARGTVAASLHAARAQLEQAITGENA